MNDVLTKNSRLVGITTEALRGTCHGAHCEVALVHIDQLVPYRGNARTHSRQQIEQISKSIERFGFLNPVLVDDRGVIIAGHGRLAAAKLLGLKEVPVLRISHLSVAERKAYALADNRLAEEARWDHEILAIELQGLIDLDFEVELAGFAADEIEVILDEQKSSDRGAKAKGRVAPGDRGLAQPCHDHAVTQAGDVWLMGNHRLICGEAIDDAGAIDAVVRHWQTLTGKLARLAASGQTFAAVQELLLAQAVPTTSPESDSAGEV
jgi:hypothetical protein